VILWQSVALFEELISEVLRVGEATVLVYNFLIEKCLLFYGKIGL
jgi:hypothetical protein